MILNKFYFKENMEKSGVRIVFQVIKFIANIVPITGKHGHGEWDKWGKHGKLKQEMN